MQLCSELLFKIELLTELIVWPPVRNTAHQLQYFLSQVYLGCILSGKAVHAPTTET